MNINDDDSPFENSHGLSVVAGAVFLIIVLCVAVYDIYGILML